MQQLSHYPDIACCSGEIADECEEGVGGEHWREKYEDDASQSDDYQGSQSDDEVLVAVEKLIFGAAVECVGELCAEVGFATPEYEGGRVDQFMNG